MNDDELHQLAADFADLTDTAQQALRSEMRSRGLGDAPEPAITLTTNRGCTVEYAVSASHRPRIEP